MIAAPPLDSLCSPLHFENAISGEQRGHLLELPESPNWLYRASALPDLLPRTSNT